MEPIKIVHVRNVFEAQEVLYDNLDVLVLGTRCNGNSSPGKQKTAFQPQCNREEKLKNPKEERGRPNNFQYHYPVPQKWDKEHFSSASLIFITTLPPLSVVWKRSTAQIFVTWLSDNI